MELILKEQFLAIYDSVYIYFLFIDDELTLAKKYGVTKLPTLIYFKNGKPIKDYVGGLS